MDLCPVCGREVTQPETGRPRIYDRDTCKKRAYERRRDARLLARVRALAATVTDLDRPEGTEA
ncbi:hypothetical protein GCM10028772_17240 [Nocardioides ultimimeridianus]